MNIITVTKDNFEETVLDAVEGKTLLPFEKFVRQVAEEVKNQLLLLYG